MLTADHIRLVLPALLVLPLLAALVLRFTDGCRAWSTALVFAAVHLALTAVIVVSGADRDPGDPSLRLGSTRSRKRPSASSPRSSSPATRCRTASRPTDDLRSLPI